MAAAQFTVGERIRTDAVSPDTLAGRVGTIQLVYRSTDDLYEVRFAGYAASKLMRGRELKRVADVP